MTFLLVLTHPHAKDSHAGISARQPRACYCAARGAVNQMIRVTPDGKGGDTLKMKSHAEHITKLEMSSVISVNALQSTE